MEEIIIIKKMSRVQRLFTLARENPLAAYIVGGVSLHVIRSFAVSNVYQQNYLKYDVERQKELEAFLAHGIKPRLQRGPANEDQ